MLAVIGLPALLPVVALLQLLFPTMLRDQSRHYRCAVQVVLTQTTLIFVHWALLRWVFTDRPWWLGDAALWWALVGVAGVGMLLSIRRHARLAGEESFAARAPVSLEYWALGVVALVGSAWAVYSTWSGASAWDWMTVVTVASLAGFAHLVVRRIRAKREQRGGFATETVFLAAQVLVGLTLGFYLHTAVANELGSKVAAEWPTFRGNMARNGAVAADDQGPSRPELLWTFDPGERNGTLHFHSSPTVAGGQVYVGGLHQLSTVMLGRLYCVQAVAMPLSDDPKVRRYEPGERIWRFTAKGSLKPVFSSPSIAGGNVYFGEGYHQDQHCRIFCLDAADSERLVWSRSTSSHVESSPTILEGRVYFGAGDDGVWCVEPVGAGEATSSEPKVVWKHQGLHVDASPAVADGTVFVGSVAGDVHRDFAALAIDAATGDERWRVRSPLPVGAAPAYHEGAVYFTLGNGKVNLDADQPEGRVWCLNAADGARQWEFIAGSSILASPVYAEGRVFAVSRDRHCYCLDAESGELVWKRDLAGPLVASPAVAGGKVYAINIAGELFCLSASDGRELWTLDHLRVPEKDAYASPTLAAGKIYVACGGKLHCIGDAESGK